MNEADRVNLTKLINQNDVCDQTEVIRNIKHSKRIREETNLLIQLRNKMPQLVNDDFDSFKELCREKCSFLFNNYTDIFYKIVNNEINISIFEKFLETLQQVEDGILDQHEASFFIGKFLKELYIDSALKKTENLDKKYKKDNTISNNSNNNLSWKDYKKLSIDNPK